MRPLSAMRLMLSGDPSKFLKISSALSEAKASEVYLYFIAIRMRIPPVTDPIFSHKDWDLESSSKSSSDVCFTGW